MEYNIDGQSPLTVHPSDTLIVPAETVHSVKNVGGTSTYVVEKGKPFLVVVDN